MLTIAIIDADVALRLAARRALEPAGFAVTDAADPQSAAPVAADLVIADPAAIGRAALRRRYPRARLLALNTAGGLAAPFTASQLLVAVRLTLAHAPTTGWRPRSPPRSARRRPRPA